MLWMKATAQKSCGSLILHCNYSKLIFQVEKERAEAAAESSENSDGAKDWKRVHDVEGQSSETWHDQKGVHWIPSAAEFTVFVVYGVDLKHLFVVEEAHPH